ncbi:CU044_5270 family protein [Dactylosporangium sp. NPDC005555]|uniref:CU044_5270 family protein n=1 Tax=Dactylosporangium sp. NPDC005555 TaxID=3154889 RepID=UPI0033AA56E5
MTERILDQLTATDPARGVPVAPGDVEALLRRASHDVTSYDLDGPARGRRRVLLAAAAIVAVGAVTGTTAVLLRGSPLPAPVPAVPAPSVATGCVDRLADGAGAAPYDTSRGAYEYLRTSSMSGGTVQMQNGKFANVTYMVERSTWTAADGSRRVRTVTQQPTYPDETSRTFFRDNPGRLPELGTTMEDQPAGEVSRQEIPAADPAAMADALYRPRENGPSQAVNGVTGLVQARVLDLPHRAALLRFLARTDGVACAGEQTDPSGRTGVVVTAPVGAGPQPSPGDSGAQSVLVDPATGDVLAAGYTDDTGTIWSAVFLERGFTDERPSA